MENIDLNNLQKDQIEKTPQENEGSLNEGAQESGKRENITLEIDGQTIEAVKYYFEYPEGIQKETGILGYERTKIVSEKFKNLNELDKRNQDDLIENILSSLSDGEYPYKCINHKMGGFVNSDTKKEYEKNFIEDKFFIQKIFSIDRIEKEQKKVNNLKNIFNYGGGRITHFSKNDGKQIDSNLEIGQISGEYLQKNNVSLFKKFNLNPRHFWGLVDHEDIGFGFPVLYDPLFNEYLKNSINVILKDGLSEADQFEENFGNDDTVKDVFALYLISEYDRLGHPFGDPSNDTETNKKIKDEFVIKIDEIAKNSIKEAIGIDDPNVNVDIGMGKYVLQQLFGNYPGYDSGFFERNIFKASNEEIDIGIFINHDEIPQLSWGHAKYAHYFNDKSFNFFKFKHADHLPVKSDLEN